MEEKKEIKGRKVCLYLRVSSQRQEMLGSLKRQEERMREWVKENVPVEWGELIIIKDVASAFGSRKGLQKLVDGIIQNEVSKVISEHQDRLSRTGSELRLLEHLAQKHSCDFVFAKSTIDDQNENAYLTRELLDYITVISNRISSKKSAEVCRAKVPEEAVKRARELLAEGLGLVNVMKRMKKEGWTCEIKNKTQPIKYSVMRRILKEQAKLNLQPESPPDVIDQFVKENCRVGKEEKAYSAELYQRYLKWCGGKRSPITKRSFAHRLQQLGFVTYSSTLGRRWKGLSLIES